MKLQYVFSAPNMFRLGISTWELEFPDKFNTMSKIFSECLGKIKYTINQTDRFNAGIDILYNAYTDDPRLPERLNRLDRMGFDKIYADSGGLQMLTLKRQINDETRKEVYKNQIYSDFAMCFDEIPVRVVDGFNPLKNNIRVLAQGKQYIPELKKDCALKTANNIVEQIATLKDINSSSKVLYIIQGNTYQDMIDWFRDGISIIPNSSQAALGGFSMANSCMGTGPLESVDIMAAYRAISDEAPKSIATNHLHLLGIGSVNRLIPVLYLHETGFIPDNTTISFDSTSFSISYMMAKFVTRDGIQQPRNISAYIKFFTEQWELFEDIYKKYCPTITKEKFIKYTLDTVNSQADAINFADDEFDILFRAHVPLTAMYNSIGFFHNIENIIRGMKKDHSPLGMLKHVKNIDDYHDWWNRYHHKIKTIRLARKHSATIDSLFE